MRFILNLTGSEWRTTMACLIQSKTVLSRICIMKLNMLQQLFTALTGALMALAIIWFVPNAQAAINLNSANMAPRGVAADTLLTETRVLSYQGRLLNPSTLQPQPDGAYSITFSLYNTEAGGSVLWSETKSVTVNKGLFYSLLGDTTALNLANFNGQDLWLGVKVGADAEATPRQRVAHVAYALHADVASSALQAANAFNADYAANASSAASASDSLLFNGHSYSEFYKGTEAVQINSSVGAGANHYWFTFGYSADQLIIWRVKPTTAGGKFTLDVETELAADGTVTYYLRVTNVGTITSGYQVIRHHFSR
jgi:hypothetical protein